MSRIRKTSLMIVLMLTARAGAMIQVGGKDPVTDHNWPTGTLDVANHGARQSWTEGPPFGGGLWTFYYRGDTGSVIAVVDKFAAIRSPDLLLVVHDGVTKTPFVAPGGDGDGRVDWTFSVWTPENFYDLYSDAGNLFLSSRPEFRGPLPPPRLDVWTGGGIDWARVKVPAGIRVVDERSIAHGYKPEDGSVVVAEVYDLLTSKPLPGSTLVISTYDPAKPAESRWAERTQAASTADGRIELKNVPAGSHEIALRCPGYAPRIVDSTDFRAGTFKSYSVRMCPALEQKGRVVDSADKPLPGVMVRLDAVVAIDGTGYVTSRVNENQETVTNADGRFTLPGLPRGEAQLAVRLGRYCQLDPLQIVRLSGDELVLRMTPGGSIHVTAVDHAGKPVSGVVSVWDQSGERRGTWGGGTDLDADGRATFENVPPGKYFVSADPAARFNKAAVLQAVEVKPGETTNVQLSR